MANRHFKRRWDESRGDNHDSWGASTWYFEVGEDGWPTRQVEVYDAGPTLRYGRDHPEDSDGGLGQARLDELEDWASWAIAAEEFESFWESAD